MPLLLSKTNEDSNQEEAILSDLGIIIGNNQEGTGLANAAVRKQTFITWPHMRDRHLCVDPMINAGLFYSGDSSLKLYIGTSNLKL